MLKESGRERINAVYGTKEQCRKEFQDEITRLRHQFQLVCIDINPLERKISLEMKFVK